MFFWDIHRFAGTPLAGDLQAALFYPLNLPYYLMDTGRALAIMTLFHLGLAGVFMYIYLMHITGDRGVSFFGGLLFALGCCAIHAARAAALCSAVWLPLVLLFFERSMAGDTGSLIRNSLLGAVALGMSLLGGFPQVSFHILYFLGFYAAYYLTRAALRLEPFPSHRPMAAAALIICIGTLLASVALFPAVILSRSSPRQQLTDPSWYGAAYALKPSHLAAYFTPFLQILRSGRLPDGELSPLGLLPIILSFFALRGRTRERGVILWALFLLFFILSFGLATPLYNIALAAPIAGKIRCPIRFLFPANTAMVILASLGLWGMIERIAPARRLPIIAALCIFSMAGYGFLARTMNPPISDDVYRRIPALLKVPAREGRILTTPGLQDTCANLGHIAGYANIVGYGALVLGPYIEYLFFNDVGRLPTQRELGEAANFGYALPLRRIDSPMIRLVGLRYVFQGRATRETIDVKRTEIPGAFPKAFLVHRARVLPDPGALLAAMAHPDFDPRREVLLSESPSKIDAPPGFIRQGSASVEEYSPDRIAVRVKDNACIGYLVMGDPFDMEWTATVGGRPATILRAYHVLRAVAVPPGSFEVILRYRPLSLYAGAWASGITLALIIAALIISSRKSCNTAPSYRHGNGL
jgi:hypothetical protein